jgi:SAM-dependent methyltransferase
MIPSGTYETLLSGYYNMRTLMYAGHEVYCPICKKQFKSFIDDHACPSCGSGRRHRLLYLYLEQKTNFFTAPLKVLHFAPEHCFYKRFPALDNLEYISGDLDSPRAMQKIDMTAIQYPDEYFDVVISSHVLEHVPDDRKAMRELLRVMKTGGWAIHQAPINYELKDTFEDPAIQSNEDRLKHYGHIDHKRVYGRDYIDRLRESGFTVVEDDFVTTLPPADIKKYGLDSWERVYFCQKRYAMHPEEMPAFLTFAKA